MEVSQLPRQVHHGLSVRKDNDNITNPSHPNSDIDLVNKENRTKNMGVRSGELTDSHSKFGYKVPESPHVQSTNGKNVEPILKKSTDPDKEQVKNKQVNLEVKSDELQPDDSASNKKVNVTVTGPTEERNRESSFVRTVKQEAMRLEHLTNSSVSSRHSRKKIKKGIFVSYSPDAGFMERKFVVEVVKQFKENNLSEDIWFDKDEKNTDSPCWFSLRMEAVERCRAAVLVLSDSYFSCPVSVYEGKALFERQKADPNSVKIYAILYHLSEETEIPKIFHNVLPSIIDLTKEHAHKSIAEKTSVVVGAFMVDLERIACIHAPPPPYVPETEATGEYRKKKICQWTVNDLQEWIFKLSIKEFYRQSLAENMVDGFLLMAVTDQDMTQHLAVDSRVVRKKIMQQILITLDKEHKLPDNWHLRARTQRPKPATIYMIYDPTDVRLAQNLKQDLIKKGLQVIHHQKLGQSKEEFLRFNGPLMASASFIMIVMTDAATNSPFVFHEVLFADWLGKKLLTLMFQNNWHTLRPSLKAVLGECPAVDFETRMYGESMDIVEHHIKPIRMVPGVVLEQSYLTKMQEGLKPLSALSNNQISIESAEEMGPTVFISYQWDMQSKVEDIRRILESSGLTCWADISPTMSTGPGRGHSSMSSRSANSLESSDTLQSQIQRNMKAAGVVVSCVTPKYMQSDNCVKDLTLAETLHKSIVPVMLRFCPWPPEGAPSQVRKILAKHIPIDLSNEKLFKQNIHSLIEKVKRIVHRPL